MLAWYISVYLHQWSKLQHSKCLQVPLSWKFLALTFLSFSQSRFTTFKFCKINSNFERLSSGTSSPPKLETMTTGFYHKAYTSEIYGYYLYMWPVNTFLFWLGPLPQKIPHHWLSSTGWSSTRLSWCMHVNNTARWRQSCPPEKLVKTEVRVFGEVAAHE